MPGMSIYIYTKMRHIFHHHLIVVYSLDGYVGAESYLVSWLVSEACQMSMSAQMVFNWRHILPGQADSWLYITT